MPKFLTTHELAEATAGGDSYIRTRNNEVKGLAIRFDINPKAPEVVCFGHGPRMKASAQLFLSSGVAVPTYVKRDVNAWEYFGNYRATAIRNDPDTIQKYELETNAQPGNIAGLLFLEDAAEPKIRVSGGGYADAKTRKEIETAAIAFVTQKLEKQGFAVHDRQRENRGFDLLAVSDMETLLVEVKGTDSPLPRFFISRNEWKCGQSEIDWRLYVVCQARTEAFLHIYTANDLTCQFSFDPLAWECTQN